MIAQELINIAGIGFTLFAKKQNGIMKILDYYDNICKENALFLILQKVWNNISFVTTIKYEKLLIFIRLNILFNIYKFI